MVDDTGQPISGACVVLNHWHIHTDGAGFFHWSVENPLPEQVEMRAYKRYSDRYETREATVPFSQVEDPFIVLSRIE